MTSAQYLKISCFILTLLALAFFDLNLFVISLIFGWFLSGIVSVLFHRKISHRAFQYRNKFTEYISYLLMIMTGQGSPMAWTAIHRMHHAKTDTDEDPQSPHSVGKFKTFISWYTLETVNPKIMIDVLRDKKIMYIHNHYNKLFLAYAVFLFAVNPLYCLYFAGVSVTICSVFVGIVNTWGHDDLTQSEVTYAKNIPLPALYWGEGYHKTHHLMPTSTNLGPWDWGRWLIKLLAVSKS